MMGEPERSLKIEAYSPSDLDEIMEIENVSFTLPWTRKSYEDIFPLGSIFMWVAKMGDEVVGYMLLQIAGPDMELHTFAVKPEYRRRGVGLALMRRMEQEAKVNEVKRIYLQVRPTNTPARTLYELLGFKPVGIRRGYYLDNKEDAIIMRWELV